MATLTSPRLRLLIRGLPALALLGAVALFLTARAGSQEPAAGKTYEQMLAGITEKSVEATLQVRNKLLTAYQDIMRMGV